MRTGRFSIVRATPILIVALAAMLLVFARSDSPASAHGTSKLTFDPQSSVSISDTTPGAHADIKISFSVDAPDSFPNITNKPAIQFIPKAWGVDPNGPLGGASGTFNTLTTIGLFGANPCVARLTVNFDMFDSTPDTGYDPATGTYDPQKLASSLDLGGDAHPMGAGFSGQFVDDPNFSVFPSDFGLKLVKFIAGEKWADPSYWQWAFRSESGMYRDVDGSNKVSVNDVRLQVSVPLSGQFAAGSVVAAGDPDVGWTMKSIGPWSQMKHDEGVAANLQMDPGEHVYNESFMIGGVGTVSDGDRRLFVFEDQAWGSTVEVLALTGGVTRYPDFLNLAFPPQALGNPLARQFGQTDVFGSPVSLNLVTFRPGQLPGYPASLGYPTVVVVLNPLQLGQDPAFMALTSDLCTPLALTSTNLGVSQDNPETPSVDESGFARLTNPKSEKGEGSRPHTFTLVVESQPDADDDGIENMLDTCPLDPNINDLDQRSGLIMGPPTPGTPDDTIDAACDPLEFPPADWGTALVPFNADEKGHTRWGTTPQLGDAYNSWIFRDNDGSGKVSVGDDRLVHPRLAPGVVQVGDSDINKRLFSFLPVPASSNFKHAENVAANGLYDPGENIYSDLDGSGDVSFNWDFVDLRLLFEGSWRGAGWTPDVVVAYIGNSARDPSGSEFMVVLDEDQDTYADNGDNCAVVANGVEVLNIQRVSLRVVNFLLVARGDLIGPSEQTDTDGDGIGDACEGAEHGAQCLNDVDDDGDGVVNDGCPRDHPDDPGGVPSPPSFGFGESVISGGDFGWCQDNVDNDGDLVVNDGCPPFPQYDSEGGADCNDADDDNGNGRINEGCPTVYTGGAAETGDQCNNADDEDGDGRPNDGCPSVDAAGEKFTVNGHVHQLTIERAVTIDRHGVKLDDLDGKKKVASGGSASYSVAVENKESDDAQDAPTALRVAPGDCATVNGAVGMNSTTLSLNPDQTKKASFRVDWSGCPDGEYTVEADACHAGDPAPAGFFGSGACPGSDPHGQVGVVQHQPDSATASSSTWGRPVANAIDNDPSTFWCTRWQDRAPGNFIQVNFNTPVAVERVDVENPFGTKAFLKGEITMSNGFSQVVDLSGTGEGSFSVPRQEGVSWVRFTGLVDKTPQFVDEGPCMSEFKVFSTEFVQRVDTNPEDDAVQRITVKVGP